MTSNHEYDDNENQMEWDVEVEGQPGNDVLSLKDLDFVEGTKAPETPAIPSQAGEPESIPAVLFDELLMQEISSIPDKMGFKIGEVAELLGIKQYVLRYWETEFDVLKPKKASNNQRLYTKKDVENAFLVRKLLHRDRFSIEGARHALRELKNHVKKEKQFSMTNEAVTKQFSSLRDRAESLLHDVTALKILFR